MNKKLLDFRGVSTEEQFWILSQQRYKFYGKWFRHINLKVGRIVVQGTDENPFFVEANQYYRHFRDDPSHRALKAGVIRRKTKIAKLLKQLESAKN